MLEGCSEENGEDIELSLDEWMRKMGRCREARYVSEVFQGAN